MTEPYNPILTPRLIKNFEDNLKRCKLTREQVAEISRPQLLSQMRSWLDADAPKWATLVRMLKEFGFGEMELNYLVGPYDPMRFRCRFPTKKSWSTWQGDLFVGILDITRGLGNRVSNFDLKNYKKMEHERDLLQAENEDLRKLLTNSVLNKPLSKVFSKKEILRRGYTSNQLTRAKVLFRYYKLKTMRDLAKLTLSELRQVQNVGPGSIQLIVAILKEHDLKPGVYPKDL